MDMYFYLLEIKTLLNYIIIIIVIIIVIIIISRICIPFKSKQVNSI